MLQVAVARIGRQDQNRTAHETNLVNSALFDSSRDALCVLDSDRKITSMNPAFEELFGYDVGVVGECAALLFHEDDVPLKFGSARTAGAFCLRYRTAEGRLFDGETKTQPVADRSGNIVAFLLMIRDVSPRTEAARAINNELRACRARLFEQGRFLSEMGKEIRQPLDLALQLVTEVRDGTSERAARRQASSVFAAVSQTLTTLDDALDLSRVKSGRITFERNTFDPIEVAKDAVTLFRPRAQARGVALSLEVDPGASFQIEADEARFGQALHNMLTHVIQHGEGPIRVEMMPLVTAAERHLVVQLSGGNANLPVGKLPTMFDCFGEEAREGSGLGLAVARAVVEAMGGKIGVVGTGGAQSLLWFSLPMRDVISSATDKQGPRILIGEDQVLDRHMVSTHLRRIGARYTIVPTGEGVLEQAVKKDWDAIFVSLGLGGLDGMQTAQRLRALPLAKAHLPIIGMSPHPVAEDSAIMLAGFDRVLTKPFSLHEIEGILSEFVEHEAA